ncbi:MAG: site-specific DNA-methyltransferase [Phycisphaerae bacterium]|jgi:site-specific DNA-methyltransferase (adenine-specific)
MSFENQVINDDCVTWLAKQKEPFADLIFADPPFNIGYKYDVYDDRKQYREYRQWTFKWMRACAQVLKPHGSFWIAIGDEYAAEVRFIARRLGLTLRNWIIWHYTFGQNTRMKFARSHAHLFYFTKSQENFTFNPEAVAVASDRLKEYNDKRAAPLGKVPFDVWIDFPRVCGTFSEREGWHPCQMPEGLLSRIVRACTDIGDRVLDPFAGSGTTLVVAKKLRRTFTGIELSEQYVEGIEERIKKTVAVSSVGTTPRTWTPAERELLASLYVENAIPSEQLHKHMNLWVTFVQQFNLRIYNVVAGEREPDEIWSQLERMRKSGKLGRVRVHASVATTGDLEAPLIPAKELERMRRVQPNDNTKKRSK